MPRPPAVLAEPHLLPLLILCACPEDLSAALSNPDKHEQLLWRNRHASLT